MIGSAKRRGIPAGFVLLITMGLALALTGCPSQPGSGNTIFGGGKQLPFFGTLKPPEPPAPDPSSVWPPRAVWAVRQEWKSAEQITSLMESAKQAGLNTVLFQVRGNGTVYYHSSIEPFDYDDPGFDPLEVACREAHRRGLAIQAWVNVMPAWKGRTPPANPRQLYNTHPDWFWYDQNGRRQPLADFYVSLNPCLPEVRQHIVSVFSEIVHNYPVDGLQLDYIRFPNEPPTPTGSDYPYDTRTLALYRQATGKRPQDDKQAWINWRVRQVTQLVREIRQMTQGANRPVRLTASCGPDFKAWRAEHFQDGPTWLREKLLDLVFVMNYTADTRTFVRRQQAWRQAAPGSWIAAGIDLGGGRQPKPTATIIEQLKLAAEWGHGFCLFAASGLFSNSPQAQARLEALRPTLLSMQPRSSAMRPDPDAAELTRGEVSPPGHSTQRDSGSKPKVGDRGYLPWVSGFYAWSTPNGVMALLA